MSINVLPAASCEAPHGGGGFKFEHTYLDHWQVERLAICQRHNSRIGCSIGLHGPFPRFGDRFLVHSNHLSVVGVVGMVELHRRRGTGCRRKLGKGTHHGAMPMCTADRCGAHLIMNEGRCVWIVKGYVDRLHVC